MNTPEFVYKPRGNLKMTAAKAKDKPKLFYSHIKRKQWQTRFKD